MNPLRRLLLAPLAAAALGASVDAQVAADSPAANRIRADVEYLASDLLEGRDTGSRGYDLAAAYVVSEFRAMGLKPAGENGGWYQQVPFRRASMAQAPEATLTLSGKARKLTSGVDFAVRPSVTQKQRVMDAPLVFVGHGISDPHLRIDDYAGIDARGKVVVVLEGTPARFPTEIAAHLDSAKAEMAASKGAVGLIQIANTGARNLDRVAFVSRPVVDWVDPTGKTQSESSALPLVAAVSRKLASQLLSAAGQDLARLNATAKKQSVRGFDLPARLRLSDSSHWQDFTSPEVIGLLPGTDPVLKDEYVVLMAHLDHLGLNVGAKPGEDNVFNGALDNAAGVATMLEAARTFVASGKPPRRSVLFIANTGEEKGLRGADYFAANPTVPIEKIVGLVDLDMPVLLYDFVDVTAFGAEHSTVARTVAEAAGSMGLKVAPDPMPEEAIFTRSDHYRFVTRGVPAVLLMTGHGNGGKAAWQRFLDKTYHSVKDDVSQPILWRAGARYAELNYRIARALADADARPLWYQGDYFGDRFAPGRPRAPAPANPGTR